MIYVTEGQGFYYLQLVDIINIQFMQLYINEKK